MSGRPGDVRCIDCRLYQYPYCTLTHRCINYTTNAASCPYFSPDIQVWRKERAIYRAIEKQEKQERKSARLDGLF